MSRKRNRKTKAVSNTRSVSVVNLSDFMNDTIPVGYTRLDRRPEIVAGCRKIATLISSMTIHLMTNTENGDQRIINELSKKVDIKPCKHMTRSSWMELIIMNLLLYGKGNSIVMPETADGILQNLIPIDPDTVILRAKNKYDYTVLISGIEYSPEDLLHFTLNPSHTYPWKGSGITTCIKELSENLAQASQTEKAFMNSKWKPSIIIKVDALTEEFSGPEGRENLLNDYIANSEAGKPWIIPSEQFSVEQVKPLSLADLAINDNVKMDKQAVASVLGIPAFVLGVGNYTAGEWDNFIANTIRPMALNIQQEMTNKLLISPKWYWKFNMHSLYSYDIKNIADVYSNLYVRGIVDGNEVRERLSLSPREGLNELVVLENYIPLSMIGEQKKLNQEGEE